MLIANQWLSWLNCILIGLIGCLLISTAFIWLRQPNQLAPANVSAKQSKLPKGAFEQPPEAYKRIGEPLLVLQTTPPSLQIPDLRQQLIYYGKNGRPDAQPQTTFLHFSFNGSRHVVSVSPQEKLYLVYEKKNNAPSRYAFSPNNSESSLWIEAASVDNEAVVKAFIKNDKNEIITEPESHAQFHLQEKEFVRFAGASWELGTYRVDGTLLARQKARWYGPDRFLERHGGEEYKEAVGKQRIDFGENDDIYSVFVGAGDCLIWDQNRWKSALPGEQSLHHPLLVIRKIDERLMTFELWDVEGKGKIILNLLKSTEPWATHNAHTLQHLFKFVGARTKTQYVFEISRERMHLRPSDWLLMTAKGWKKIETEEEIDNYVKRKTPGALFVFEGVTRKDDRQVILGTLYNPSRSDFQAIEIPTQQGGVAKSLTSKEIAENEEDEEEEDDDIEDDDDDDEEEKIMHPVIRSGTIEVNTNMQTPNHQVGPK